ncbi:MAG: PxxKW family cysteine-rich protein [Myxococcota bacterium]|jgi:hypothetical protein
MKCQTIKPGIECSFWNKQCTYPGGACYECVEQCLSGGKKGEGCERIIEKDGKKYCAVFAEPESRWQYELCNFATHQKVERKVFEQKINPLKLAKRQARQGSSNK